MKINNKTHITLTDEDVKTAIVKYLSDNQGLSGIFDIEFRIKNNPIPTHNYRDSIDHWVFDGAEVTVDLNDK
jgi:hypothetical protein